MSDPGNSPSPQPVTLVSVYLFKKDMEDLVYLLGGVQLGVGIAVGFVHNLQVWRLLVLWQSCVFELLAVSLLRALRPSLLGVALSCQIYLALSDSFIFNPQSSASSSPIYYASSIQTLNVESITIVASDLANQVANNISLSARELTSLCSHSNRATLARRLTEVPETKTSNPCQQPGHKCDSADTPQLHIFVKNIWI